MGKNGLESFVIQQKVNNIAIPGSPTFPFLTDTKLYVHGVYTCYSALQLELAVFFGPKPSRLTRLSRSGLLEWAQVYVLQVQLKARAFGLGPESVPALPCSNRSLQTQKSIPVIVFERGWLFNKKPFEVSIRPLSSILYTLVTFMTWIPTSTSSFIVVQVTQRAVRFCLFKQPSLLRNSHTCARAIEQDSHKVQFLEHKNLLYSSQKQNRTEDGFSKSTNSHILSVTVRRVL